MPLDRTLYYVPHLVVRHTGKHVCRFKDECQVFFSETTAKNFGELFKQA